MGKMSYLAENALNAVCPYFTMFPLEYPIKVLTKFKKDNPIVMGPFCGRGTSLFAARKMGMDAWGIDSSPVAVAIAKAKMASCQPQEVVDLAAQILSSESEVDVPNSAFFRWAYHKSTLKKICQIREGLLGLDYETNASVILRAVCLGALHGPLTKTVETASYFSNQMPRTFSSKPDYSVKYWKERNMKSRKVDVLDVISRRVHRLHGLSDQITGSFDQITQGDSRLNESFKSARNDFTTIITSPPYYGMKTYVQDQWLRNWFLGGPAFVDYSINDQLDHGDQSSFAESLGRVWKNMASSEATDLRMFVRFGIIPSAKVDAKMLFNESLESSGVSWRVISTRHAKSASEGKRQAGQMKSNSQAAVEFDFHVLRM